MSRPYAAGDPLIPECPSSWFALRKTVSESVYVVYPALIKCILSMSLWVWKSSIITSNKPQITTLI